MTIWNLTNIDTAVYEEGREANKNGINIQNNPYVYTTSGSVKSKSWVLGWMTEQNKNLPVYEPELIKNG